MFGSAPRSAAAAWLLLLWQSLPAHAAALPLVPANTRIGLTVYAMGLVPQAGQFSGFSGALVFDPGHPQRCRVTMLVQVASPAMSTGAHTRLALGPSLLDAAHYPTLRYDGRCAPAGTAGTLTLHGVTHPLTLITTRNANTIAERGTLHRQDYAIRGLPGLIGGTVHIVFSVDLPPDLAEELPR